MSAVNPANVQLAIVFVIVAGLLAAGIAGLVVSMRSAQITHERGEDQDQDQEMPPHG